MKVTLTASPELLKISEIGEFLVEADDSFRKHLVGSVLSAVRNGHIPLRTENGFKASPKVLAFARRRARLAAKHKAEANAEKPSHFDIEMTLLRREKQRYIASEAHMQAIARGFKIPLYDAKIRGLAQNKESFLDLQRELQDMTEDFEQNKIYRNHFVQLAELVDWLRNEQGFDVTILESSIPTDGELARMLGKWFDKPLSVLPAKQRRYADVYIPKWPELSAVERRACAIEADRKAQETIDLRFQRAHREKKSLPSDRFTQRAMEDGFETATRESAGVRDVESKIEKVNLSEERCRELAKREALTIADWIEITGIGRGKHGAYLVKRKSVSFIKWERSLIAGWPPSDQADMERENEAAPLIFPCTPARLIQFLDNLLVEIHALSVPDAFRRAVTESTQETNTTPQVPAEPLEQSEADSSRVPKKTPAMVAKQAKLSKIIDALESYAERADLNFDREAMPGPLGDDWHEEGSFHWLCAKLCRDFKKAKTTFESYRAGICAVQKYAKAGDFYTKALPHIPPIFRGEKKAR